MHHRMRRLAALLLGSLGLLGAAATPPQAPQAPTQDAGAQWDRVFSSKDAHWKTDANAFLAWTIERIDREKLLPSKRALDLAMGDGRNALLLAEKGFTVTGIDVSEVALEKARAKAKEKGLALDARKQDLFTFDYGKEEWDLISIVYFNPALGLAAKLKDAVKPGGLIVIEGQGSEHQGGGPPPATRFKPNELLRTFSDWRILHYEDGRFESDWNPGPPTHVVRLLARKPAAAPK